MKAEALSLEALLRVIVRDELGDVLRAHLAPVVADLATLKAAAPPALASVEEAAERLAVAPATVRRWLCDGTISGRRIGRSWKVDLGALRTVRP
jgi:excisionase family DNA binding protein